MFIYSTYIHARLLYTYIIKVIMQFLSDLVTMHKQFIAKPNPYIPN